MKKVIVAMLALAIVFSLTGCGSKAPKERTLCDMTYMRLKVSDSMVVEAAFYGEEPCKEGHTECCVVKALYYVDSPLSDTGKQLDSSKTDVVHIPINRITEYSLMINGIDYYTYKIKEDDDGDEYVEFSKPFFESKKWEVSGWRN